MNKPYIRIPHLILEAIGFITTIIAFVYALVMSATVKGEVPTHYNIAGEVDGYGSASSMLIIPIMMFFLVLMLTLMFHFMSPKHWNMPFVVRPGREVYVYAQIGYMITEMNAEFGIFTLLETLLFLNPEVSGFEISILLVISLFSSIIVHGMLASKVNKM